ncbi:MAG: hypothetical protein ACHQK8_01270 [Bacteroidia bacterium]
MKPVRTIQFILFLIFISSSCQKPDTNPNNQTKLHIGGKIFNALDSSGIANRKVIITDQLSGSSTINGTSITATTDINGNYSIDFLVSQNHNGFKISIDNYDSLYTDKFFDEIPFIVYLNSPNSVIDVSKLNLAVCQRAWLHIRYINLNPIKIGDAFDTWRSSELFPLNYYGADFDYFSFIGKTELRVNTFTIAKVKSFLDCSWNQNHATTSKSYQDTLFLNPQDVKEIIVQ